MMKSTFTSTFTTTKAALVCGIAAFALPASVSAQEQWSQPYEETTLTVTGNLPADISGLPEGPEIDGFISARSDNRIQVTTADGSKTVVFVADGTEIKARGGFLGLGRTSLEGDQLYNGVPVTVRTVQWDDGLIAQRISIQAEVLAFDNIFLWLGAVYVLGSVAAFLFRRPQDPASKADASESAEQSPAH